MMAGHRNVLAIQGTNGFDETDIKTLNTHGVQAVTLMLDGDDAGKKATERLKEKLSSFSCRTLALPDGEDPNSFLRKHGAEKLAQFIPEGQDMAANSTGPKARRFLFLPGLLPPPPGLRRTSPRPRVAKPHRRPGPLPPETTATAGPAAGTRTVSS
jgi:hypothetical protein